MSKLTRSGVAYDITISPHNQVMNYDGVSIKYTFSSNLYKEIFLRKLEDNRKEVSANMTKRYGVEINHDILSDLRLYKKTEKRGFLLTIDDKDITCLNTIRLDGNKVIILN